MKELKLDKEREEEEKALIQAEEGAPKLEDNKQFIFDCRGKVIDLTMPEALNQNTTRGGKFKELVPTTKYKRTWLRSTSVVPVLPGNLPIVKRDKAMLKTMAGINNDYLIVKQPTESEMKLALAKSKEH